MNTATAIIENDPRFGTHQSAGMPSAPRGPLPAELRSNNLHVHQAESPWARTPPASAIAALQELGAKLFSDEDRKKCSNIEKQLADLEKELTEHANEEDLKQQIWNLFHDDSLNLSIEERVDRARALESQRADIPIWKTQVEDKYQKTIVGLRPYAGRLLHALAEKIEAEVAEIQKHGVGGRNEFWQIDSGDRNRFRYPLYRLADFTASHIRTVEQHFSPEKGWLVRQVLIDSAVIKQRASLIRG
jgi:hypothetical protein